MVRCACSTPTCRIFSFLLLLFPFLFSSQVHASQLNTTQARIVKSIFHTIRLYLSPNEVLNSDPCAWRRVVCYSTDYSSDAVIVTGLSFFDLGITFNNSTALSSFCSLICSLNTLESLDLSSNHLTSIPGAFFSSCTGLSTLDMSQNSLSGKIPSQLSNLTNLSYLYLNGNNLSGSIPSTLSNLTNLANLYLNGNNLSGSIPPTLTYMASLSNLQLGGNKLSGTIPMMPPSITTLNLSRNYFGGPIPSSCFDYLLSGLVTVDLSHNNFSGSVPNSLTFFQNLTFLDLSYNNLSGELPIFRNQVNLEITGNNFFSSPAITDSISTSGSEISTVGREISTVILVVIVGSFVNGMVASFSLVFMITTCLKKPESTDSDGSHPQGTTRPSVETPSLDRYLELYQRWQHAALVEGSTSP